MRPSARSLDNRGLAKKLLLVEDHLDSAAAMLRLLAAAGFEVVHAANGQQALRLLPTYRPDVVLTDLLMPEMDGLELLRNLQQFTPRVPIIAISADGSHLLPTSLLQTAQHFGAARILLKPVAIAKLVAAINQVTDANPLPPDSAAT